MPGTLLTFLPAFVGGLVVAPCSIMLTGVVGLNVGYPVSRVVRQLVPVISVHVGGGPGALPVAASVIVDRLRSAYYCGYL